MDHFFVEHPVIQVKKGDFTSYQSGVMSKEDVQCEEAMLEAFGE
jgi:hypothetical protein